MWPYWIMFLVPALLALVENARHRTAPTVQLRAWKLQWFILWLVLVFLVGWRHEVGGDWQNYLNNFNFDTRLDLVDSLTGTDPGYLFLEWIARQMGWGIYGVNLLGAILFAWGLVDFALKLPRPWLAIAVSIPYLVIVVAMGYERQGIALGLMMLGLSALNRGRTIPFLICNLVAATFHSSGVLMIPIAAMAATKNRFWIITSAALLLYLGYATLLSNTVANFKTNYIDAQYNSQGAFVRLLLNLIPALIFLYYRDNLSKYYLNTKLWTYMSLLSILLFISFFVVPSSTAVDRIALYMIPLQLVVASSLTNLFKDSKRQSEIVLMVLLYYGLIELVWLNFAVNATGWVPYRFLPFESIH